MALTNNIRLMQQIQAEWIRGILPNRDVRKTCIKLCSEAAEVAESVGYLGQRAVASELADTLILLLDIAELCDIDIVQAFHYKMDLNRRRQWQVGDGCIRHLKEEHGHGHAAHESGPAPARRETLGDGENHSRTERVRALGGSGAHSLPYSYAHGRK